MNWFFRLFQRAAANTERRPAAPRGTQPPLGIVAGRGIYPLELARAARQAGVEHLNIAAMIDETDPAIAEIADSVDWLHVGQLRKGIDTMHRREVRDVIFAGQVRPGRLFGGFRPDFLAFRLLLGLKERNAHTLFGAVADTFGKEGFRVLPAITYMEESLAQEGVIGNRRPSRLQRQEIEFGSRIAREVSRLDIGQTVVVKKGTVLAVEGFEGTDKAVRRGGELGRGRATVVKVAKPGHDMRFDVPCIGLGTVESLKAAGIHALAVQAGKTLFLEKAKVIAALDQAGIVVVGIS